MSSIEVAFGICILEGVKISEVASRPLPLSFQNGMQFCSLTAANEVGLDQGGTTPGILAEIPCSPGCSFPPTLLREPTQSNIWPDAIYKTLCETY
jgi:hypothetical protein